MAVRSPCFLLSSNNTAEIALILKGVTAHLFPDKKEEELSFIRMQFANLMPLATEEVLENGKRLEGDELKRRHVEVMTYIAQEPACAHERCSMKKFLKRCSGCKAVMYCSNEHQKAHWNTHKQQCHIISEAAAKAKKHPDCFIQ